MGREVRYLADGGIGMNIDRRQLMAYGSRHLKEGVPGDPIKKPKKRTVAMQKNDTDGGIVCSFCGNPWEVLSIAEDFGCYSMCAWCGTKIGGIDGDTED